MVDLAVAIVVGGAFKAVVDSFVAAFITPLIGMIGTQDAAATLYFTANGSNFPYGLFITATISFLIIAALIYFCVVLPINALMARVYPNAVSVRECPECLSSDIPQAATRCHHCCASIKQDFAAENIVETVAPMAPVAMAPAPVVAV